MTQKTNLSKICKIIGGGTPKTTNSEYWGGNIPWLSVVDFSGDDRWVSNTEKHITELGLNCSSTKLLDRGDIIISARGTVGEIAQITRPMAFNQSCYGIRAEKDIDQNFLYYLLKKSVSSLQKQAHGGVFDTITRSTFNNIEVELPDLTEQKMIAEILGGFDEKIVNVHAQISTLNELGQTLFRHFFTDNTEKKCWGTVKLGDKIHPKRGKNIKRSEAQEGKIPVVSGGLEPSCYHNKANTTAPTITISASGANAGFVSLWGEDVWSADSTFIDSTVTQNIYFYYIFLKIHQDSITKMQTGSGQPHIYPKHLELLEAPNAPDELLHNFHIIIKPFFEQIHCLESQIHTLASTRDTIISKLIPSH